MTEVIGTFGLVFFGGLTVIQADNNNLDLLGVAIAHTLLLSILIYFGMRFSGAHYNPAVSVSLMITGKMTLKKGLLYIGSQLLGSFVAAVFLSELTPKSMLKESRDKSILGHPQLSKDYSAFNGMLLEIVLTFFLVFIIWTMAVDDQAPPYLYGAAIGGTVGFAILAGGPITGAAMNPARVFGPSVWVGIFTNQWIYYVGPLIGGSIAGLFYFYFFMIDRQN